MSILIEQLKKATKQNTLPGEVVYIREVFAYSTTNPTYQNTCTVQKITDTFNSSPYSTMTDEEIEIAEQDLIYDVKFSIDPVKFSEVPSENSYGLLLYTDEQKSKGTLILLSDVSKKAISTDKGTSVVESIEEIDDDFYKVTSINGIDFKVKITSNVFGTANSGTNSKNNFNNNYINTYTKSKCGSILNIDCNVDILPNDKVRIAKSTASEDIDEDSKYTTSVSSDTNYGRIYEILSEYFRICFRVVQDSKDINGTSFRETYPNTFGQEQYNYLVKYLNAYIDEDYNGKISSVYSDLISRGTGINNAVGLVKHLTVILNIFKDFVTNDTDLIIIDKATYDSFNRFNASIEHISNINNNSIYATLRAIEISCINEINYILYYIDFIVDYFEFVYSKFPGSYYNINSYSDKISIEKSRLQRIMIQSSLSADNTTEIKKVVSNSNEISFKPIMDNLTSILTDLTNEIKTLNNSIATYTYINTGGVPTPIVDTTGQATGININLESFITDLNEKVIGPIGELFY